MTSSLLKSIAITMLTLFAAHGATAGVDVGAAELAFCRSLLETEAVTILRHRPRGRTMSAGERVRLTQGGPAGMDGFYLGRTNGRLYFAPDRIASAERPVFFLPADRVRVDGGEVPAVNLRIDGAGGTDLCSPQTVMLCLDHLRERDPVSGPLVERPDRRREDVFDRLARSFARGALEHRPEFRAVEARGHSAKTARELRTHLAAYRRLAFDRIQAELRALGVASTYTTSYWRLKRHLMRERPAYLSVAAVPISVFRPPLSEWRDASVARISEVTTGTVPRPMLLPLPYSAHAVYAVTVLPPVRGWGGRLLGSRLVVFDPQDGQFNVWPTMLVRFSRSAHFLLIGRN